MKSLLKRIFIDNWQRKIFSAVLAMIVWMIVNHSLTTHKQFSNIPVKIYNLPKGKTVEGLQDNGYLNENIDITIKGNQKYLEKITKADLEIAIDAAKHDTSKIQSITKFDIPYYINNREAHKAIKDIKAPDFKIEYSNLITETIPIYISPPIGDAPEGFVFLDVVPNKISIRVQGTKKQLHELKKRKHKLHLNLNDITKEVLSNEMKQDHFESSGEVTYFVPDKWKIIDLPELGRHCVPINDPRAEKLHMTFMPSSLHRIDHDIPITLFFPEHIQQSIENRNLHFADNEFIYNKGGHAFIKGPFYVKDVNAAFVDVVKKSFYVTVYFSSSQFSQFYWNTQFLYPTQLEQKYISRLVHKSPYSNMSLPKKDVKKLIKGRFKGFMNNFRLYDKYGQKLRLKVKIKDDKLYISFDQSYNSQDKIP